MKFINHKFNPPVSEGIYSDYLTIMRNARTFDNLHEDLKPIIERLNELSELDLTILNAWADTLNDGVNETKPLPLLAAAITAGIGLIFQGSHKLTVNFIAGSIIFGLVGYYILAWITIRRPTIMYGKLIKICLDNKCNTKQDF